LNDTQTQASKKKRATRIETPKAASPLLKWAGGKRLLLPVIVDGITSTLDQTGGRYIEPFLGGGAVALHLGRPGMIVNDAIPELIEFYRTVRDEPALVAWALSSIAIMGVDEKNYYRVRDETDLGTVGPQMRAARMLYLNRLCYNGVYRVNSKGAFNVPYAKDAYRESMVKRKSRDAITSLFPHKGKIEAVSRALMTSEILYGDFQVAVEKAQAGDVVYCDPPYDGTYSAYTNPPFKKEDQERLAEHLYYAHERGAHIVVSNSDTKFIRYLYSEWATIMETEERRAINSDTKGRARVGCVLIAAEGKSVQPTS
jgi:DNA adenine methylase